jgi:hypothetical protein
MAKRTLVIERDRWIRGDMDIPSVLWDKEENAGCCLGHYAHKVSGISQNDLDYICLPDQLIGLTKRTTILSRPEFESFCNQAVKINDNRNLAWNTREAQIKKLFREHLDTEVIFK